MRTMSQKANPEHRSRPVWAEILHASRWPLVVIILFGLAFLAYRATLETTARAGGAALDTVAALGQGFARVDVTERFTSSIPEFDAAGSGNLELATMTMTETLTRSEERRVLWDQFSLGTTVAEIRVPVTYRYHLRLHDPWHLERVGPVVFVFAPPIRPSLPPAIRTEGLEKRLEEGWFHFDAAEQLASLERSITPRLELLAQSPGHVELVRERSRRAVEDFVRTWLLREDEWGLEGVFAIRVIFPDEEARDLPVERPDLGLPSLEEPED